jgi:hypothetical protein
MSKIYTTDVGKVIKLDTDVDLTVGLLDKKIIAKPPGGGALVDLVATVVDTTWLQHEKTALTLATAGEWELQPYAAFTDGDILYGDIAILEIYPILAADTRRACLYCTVGDVKAGFGEQWTSGIKYDQELEDGIEAASRLIDEELGWPDCYYAASDLSTVIRYYDTVSGLEMGIDRFLVDASLVVEVDETALGVYVPWTINVDFVAWPYNEAYISRIIVEANASKVFPTGQRLLRVTGRLGGHAQPPAPVKRAAVIMAARWFKRGMQAYQDTGAIEELGQLTYTKALDPDVKEILRVMPRRINWG